MEAYLRELETARRLAREAGALVMRHYGRVVEEDKHGEPVTIADRAANALLVQGLSETFPEDGILAEESAPSASWWDRPRLWCIDPIDGTREFLNQNGEFAVMVGLAEAGRAVAGVVYLPAEDLLLWGGPGLGAFEERGGGPPTPLRVSETTEVPRMVMAVSRSHRSRKVDRMARLLGVTRELRRGSVGVKIGMVARGEVDLYLHPGTGTKRWDSCAPEAIVAGAGGRMTDCRGRALDYGHREIHNVSGLVASNGTNHEAIIECVRPVVEKAGL